MQFTATRPHYLKWGVILGVSLSAYSLILSMTGLIGNQSMSYLTYAIIIGVLVMVMKEYRSENEGFMTFGKGVGLGTLTSLVGGAISSLFVFVYASYINTDYTQQIRDVALQQMEDNPQMTEEAMDMAMGWTETMTSPPVMFAMGLVGSVIAGLIFSLVISAIMKKNPPEEGME